MTKAQVPVKIAILDDYQNVALQMADWSKLGERVEIVVFNDHVTDPQQLVERLLPFDILCVMRERTPLPRSVLESLPQLKLIASTGERNGSIDARAAKERGIAIVNTRYVSDPTVELTWGLILASARHIALESLSLRAGGWQQHIGDGMSGKTLGVLGLGNIGTRVAQIGLAFGMQVIAWSQNLTEEKAAASGVRYVSKDDLFRGADVLSIHLILSGRTRGLVGASELALMKRSARLINTSRGIIVVEDALIEALRERRIAGAALDVFDTEPLARGILSGHWIMCSLPRI